MKHNGYAEDSVSLPEATLRTFYTASGWLTRYALACGYIERAEKAGVSTTLWYEHGTIHVRQHAESGRVLWESFDSLPQARARFKRALKEGAA